MGASGSRRKRRSAKKVEPTSAKQSTPRQRAIVFAIFGALVATLVGAIVVANRTHDDKRVWSTEHKHWHDANGNELK
jgi:hypothetical protein